MKFNALVKIAVLLLISLLNFSNGDAIARCAHEQDNYSLVFVYLGDKLPDYLQYSIGQARVFNKNCPIFLIAHTLAIEQHTNLVHLIRQHGVTVVAAESLPRSKVHADFDAIYDQNKDDFGIHQNPYWKYTTERFFYIHELMQTYQLKDVFQVECDVMLYVNLHDYLPLLHKHYKSIACPFHNDYVASVSFVYFSEVGAIKKFVEFIPYQLRGQLKDADMYLLATYKRYAPDEVDQLPTVTKELVMLAPLKSASGDTSSESWKYWYHIEDWHSIFDNDNLGTFLEVKHWGAPRIIFNVDAYTFIWEKDGEERWIPYACEKATHHGYRYRINTLHIAHKNLVKYLSIGPMPLST